MDKKTFNKLICKVRVFGKKQQADCFFNIEKISSQYRRVPGLKKHWTKKQKQQQKTKQQR